jgi:YHS domain-containing protein
MKSGVNWIRRSLAAACAAAVVVAGVAVAMPRQDAPKPAADAKAQGEKSEKSDKVIVPFFGNDVCPMSGKPVNKSKSLAVDGQTVYFCSGDCLKKAKTDPKAALAKAYAETKAVSNKTCPVSGHAIDAKTAKEVTFESRKVTLCCGDCVGEFNKTPMLYTTIAVYGGEDLKNKRCPVMDDQEASPDNLVVYKGKIVRMCCDDCPSDFAKDADKLLAKAATLR